MFIDIKNIDNNFKDSIYESYQGRRLLNKSLPIQCSWVIINIFLN